MHEELLNPFRDAPHRAGIFMDFDGTLSQIVPLPSDARPVDGAREILTRLSQTGALVSIVSGRSAHQLLDWLGPDIEIWGVHGAETVVDGRVVLSPKAEPYRPVMAGVLDAARRRVGELGIDGILVEDKAVMVNLHYRSAVDVDLAARAVGELATELARDHDLDIGTGRLTLELRPPVRFSKEEVVLNRAREADLESVLFAGDDVVDLPAFEALDALATSGVATVRVAVDSPEAPAELLERADIVVTGPEGSVRLLESLVSERE